MTDDNTTEQPGFALLAGDHSPAADPIQLRDLLIAAAQALNAALTILPNVDYNGASQAAKKQLTLVEQTALLRIAFAEYHGTELDRQTGNQPRLNPGDLVHEHTIPGVLAKGFRAQKQMLFWRYLNTEDPHDAALVENSPAGNVPQFDCIVAIVGINQDGDPTVMYFLHDSRLLKPGPPPAEKTA